MRAISLCSGLLIAVIAIISIFGSSLALEIHAVGNAAYMYTDDTWVQTAQERLGDISAIWAFSEDDIFVGTGIGAVYRWNGSTWEMSFKYAYNNAVLDIWGTSNSNIYVCLKEYYSYEGKLLHFDGSTWSEVALPQQDESYMSTYGFSEDDIYVVAFDEYDKNLIYHSLGGDPLTWELVDISSLGISMDCSEVWGSSGTDVFVMGKNGEIIHWDGIQWELMNSGVSGSAITCGIWGSSGDDVFAAFNGVIIHYDGNAQNEWTEMSLPSTPSLIYWITGTSSSNVIAGAYAAIQQYRILEYDGSQWTELTDSDYWGSSDAFMFSENNALLGGGNGRLYRYTGLDIERVDDEYGFVKSLTAVTSSPTGSFYAGSIEGDVLTFDYGSWQEIARPTGSVIRDMIAFANDDICVLTDGVAFHFDGMSWQQMGSSEMGCRKAWGLSSDNVYTADGNSIYHYDGNDWSLIYYEPGYSGEYSGWSIALYDIWGTSDSNIYAVGTYGEYQYSPEYYSFDCALIAHFDGIEWTYQYLGSCFEYSDYELNAVWGAAANDIWAAGDVYRVYEYPIVGHYTGDSWQQVEAPGFGYTSLWGATPGPDLYFLKGQSAEVHHYDGQAWDIVDISGVELKDIWGFDASDGLIVTVETNPEGLEFSVDGAIHSDSYIFMADTGATYEIGVVSPQVAEDGHEYVFAEWSDGGDTVHTIVVPDTNVTYTAYFVRSTRVTVTTEPEGLDVLVEGVTYESPYNLSMPSGAEIEISTISPQRYKGTDYYFIIWSDGGDTTHVVTLPDTNVTYTAIFADEITGDEVEPVPLVNALHQNHPNPFNPNTTISFSLKNRGHASLAVYDVAGRLVCVLIDGVKEAGPHEVTWDGRNGDGSAVASGVYFYHLEAGEYTETRKMVLLR